MKTVVVVIATLLLSLSLSFVQAADVTPASTDCSSYDDQTTCCSSDNACIFINCTAGDDRVEKCSNTTDDSGCDVVAEAVDSCPKDESANETPKCADIDNQKDCCNASNTSCMFVTCTGDQVRNVCAPADSNENVCETDEAMSDNLCNSTATTKAPAETTQAPQVTTDAPSGSDQQQDCTTYDTQVDCCAVENSACQFYNCMDAENTTTSSMCLSAGQTPECAEESDVASANMCAQSPDNPENSTQLPSTGNSEGGQQFDAPSFIGGIVLCAGVLALGYFGLKFYRSRQEKDYRSM